MCLKACYATELSPAFPRLHFSSGSRSLPREVTSPLLLADGLGLFAGGGLLVTQRRSPF